MEILQSLHVVAIICATIGSFAVGFLWYGVLFTKKWAKLTKMDMNNKEWIGKMMLQNQTFNIIWIAVLHYLLVLLSITDMVEAMSIAFLMWISFSVPPMMASIIWQRRSWCLGGIETSAYLAQSLIAAGILSFWL